MKKSGFILALTLLMVSIMSMTAFAHGHGHGRGYRTVRQQPRQTTYVACTVDGCTLPDLHEHNGTYYYCASHSTAHVYGHGHGYRR